MKKIFMIVAILLMAGMALGANPDAPGVDVGTISVAQKQFSRIGQAGTLQDRASTSGGYFVGVGGAIHNTTPDVPLTNVRTVCADRADSDCNLQVTLMSSSDGDGATIINDDWVSNHAGISKPCLNVDGDGAWIGDPDCAMNPLHTFGGTYGSVLYDAGTTDINPKWKDINAELSNGNNIDLSYFSKYSLTSISTMYGYDASDDDWDRIHAELVGGGEVMETGAKGLVTKSANYLYNVSTGDFEAEEFTKPGDDAVNNYKRVSKVEVGTYSPAKTTTAPVGAAATDVLASLEVLDLPNFCVYLQNDDAANPFTDADIFASPDGTAWVNLGWTTCDSLGHGETCVYCVSSNAYRYVKAQVTAAAGALDVDSIDAWLTGNKG